MLIQTRNAHNRLNPTRLERISRSCPQTVEYSDLLSNSNSWEKHLFKGHQNVLTTFKAAGDKTRAVQCFNLWLKILNHKGLVAYADGSAVDVNVDSSGSRLGI